MIKVLNNEKELLECEGILGIAINRLRSNLPINEYSIFGAGNLPLGEKFIASVLAKFHCFFNKNYVKRNRYEPIKNLPAFS